MTINPASESASEGAELKQASRPRKKPDAATAVAPSKTSKSATSAPSKADQVIKKLGSAKGVTVQQMIEATGWQSHSVRGFLSGIVRKKLGHELVSEVGKDGARRYRIAAAANYRQD